VICHLDGRPLSFSNFFFVLLCPGFVCLTPLNSGAPFHIFFVFFSIHSMESILLFIVRISSYSPAFLLRHIFCLQLFQNARFFSACPSRLFSSSPSPKRVQIPGAFSGRLWQYWPPVFLRQQGGSIGVIVGIFLAFRRSRSFCKLDLSSPPPPVCVFSLFPFSITLFEPFGHPLESSAAIGLWGFFHRFLPPAGAPFVLPANSAARFPFLRPPPPSNSCLVLSASSLGNRPPPPPFFACPAGGFSGFSHLP